MSHATLRQQVTVRSVQDRQPGHHLSTFPLNMNREIFHSTLSSNTRISLFVIPIFSEVDPTTSITNTLIKSNFHLSYIHHPSNTSFSSFSHSTLTHTTNINMSHLDSTRPRTRMFTRQQEELNIKRRKEASDDIIFYEDFDGRMQIISMKQMEEVTKSPSLSRMVISQPRIRMLTRQQEQKSKRRKVTDDEIILYEDLDGRTHIISMKQVEEGRTKIITTNKQKEEDIIFYEDLDGSTKINEKQNDKMDNTIKIDNKAPRSDLIIHPVNSQESGVDWEEIDREIESFLCEDPDEGKKINEDQNGKMDNTIKIVNKTLEERSELIVHPVNSRESGADWSELEDITPEDLDGSTKINKEPNDKMDNTTRCMFMILGSENTMYYD